MGLIIGLTISLCGSAAWDGNICWQASHLSTAFFRSDEIPGQKYDSFAANLAFSIPWWVAWRRLTTSSLIFRGTTSLSPTVISLPWEVCSREISDQTDFMDRAGWSVRNLSTLTISVNASIISWYASSLLACSASLITRGSSSTILIVARNSFSNSSSYAAKIGYRESASAA